MKRLTIVLTAILLVSMLFVSCKVEVDDPFIDLVSVVFSSGDASKSLNRTLEGYETSDLYWNYTAVKKDSTNLTTGQVESEEHLKDGTGFDDVTLTLSQGKWLFTLYGYKEEERTTKIYEGSTEEFVSKRSDNTAQTISIDVYPVKGESKGYLCIADNLKVQNGSNLFDKATDGYDEVITVKTSEEGENLWSDSDNDRKVELAPGSYTVVVAYEKDGITYASGTTRVTIFSNLTTTVSGTLNESTAEATLEVNDKYASANLTVEDGASKNYEFKGTPANLYDENSTTIVNAKFNKKDSSGDEPKLSLTTYSTLGANSKFRIENADAVVAGFDFSLTNATIDGVVVVKTTIASELSGVKIYHNGVLMDETACENEGAVKANGNWYYNVADGTLVFATSSFSSFAVTCAVAKNETNGKLYDSLKAAIDDVSDGDVIVLQSDIVLSSPVLVESGCSITLDLNGCRVVEDIDVESGTYGIITVQGSANLTILGNGFFDYTNSYLNYEDSGWTLGQPVAYLITVRENGQLTIENGSFHGIMGCVRLGKERNVTGEAAKVYVKGGSFKSFVEYDSHYWTFNKMDGTSTSFVITGGSFYMFDPSKGGTENPNEDWISKGYVSERKGDYYVVRAITENDVAVANGIVYSSLSAAVGKVENGATIVLLKDVIDGSGIIFESNKNLTIDFNGKKYVVTHDPAGSSGTKSQVFQLLKDSTIVLKNGTLSTDKTCAMIIQNYSDLTLDNMILDGRLMTTQGWTPSCNYVLSNNYGNTVITGNTQIISGEGSGKFAFDVYYWGAPYNVGTSVVLDENFTGTIQGNIEISCHSSIDSEANPKHSLVIENGSFTGELCIGSTGKATEVKVKSLLNIKINTSDYEFVDSTESGYKVLTKKTV